MKPTEFIMTNKDTGETTIYRWILKEDEFNDNNPMAFVWAASNGYIEQVKYLLTRADYIEMCGKKAIQAAINHDKREVVKLLLKEGVDRKIITDGLLRKLERNNMLLMIQLLKEYRGEQEDKDEQ